MAKKILCIGALVIMLVCILVACGGGDEPPSHTHSYGEWETVKAATCTEEGSKERSCSCGDKQTEKIATNSQHGEIVTQISNSSYETSYSELFSLYTSAVNHKNQCSCDLDFEELIKNMLYGEWKDSDGTYITYTYVYTDYNNTTGSTWYGTNLATSKTSGNTYYYYTKVENNTLVIGYQDKLTEDKTDNFVISFAENSISVDSLVDNKTYTLSMNTSYSKARKGNAKLAYVYIAKQVFKFKNPSSVKITSCYVDYDDKVVYATVQASNNLGGTVTTEYKLYEVAGSYYMTEYSYNYSTNINLTELNQKLKSYVASGG